MKLKHSYSARDVAALTGLSARQLQWWDARRLLSAAVASRRTAAGGFTERRYSPVDLYSPWRKSPLHSSGDASRLTALFVGCVCPICAPLTPCQPGASPLSVRRGVPPRAVYELLVLANLRRRGFTVRKIRTVLETLRRRFGVRLYDALGDGGPVTLLTDGKEIYARTPAGEFFNLLGASEQPLLVVGAEDELKALSARARAHRRRKPPRGRKRPAS